MNVMKYMLVLLSCLALCGCTRSKYFSGDEVVVAPYDSSSLWNLQVGRDYAAQGRYELAKEHYLLALASSSDVETRAIIAHDLKSVDMMIKTQR